MKTETARYAEERLRRAGQPVYLVRLYHVARGATVLEYPFSRDFRSFEAALPRRPSLAVLGRPGGNTQTVQTEQGQSSIGTFSFPLLDVGGDVLRQVSDPALALAISLPASGVDTIQAVADVSGYPTSGTLELDSERTRYTDRSGKTFTGLTRGVDGTTASTHEGGALLHNGEQLRAGQRARLLAGYATLDESDFLAFATMEVSRVSLLEDGLTFVITIADIQRTTRRQLFTGATPTALVVLVGNPITLALRILLSTGGAAAGAGTVQVTGANAVTGSGTVFTTFLRQGDFVLINPFTATEQLAQVEAVNTNTLFTSATVLTTTGAGLAYRKAGPAGRYDLLASGNGLGIAASLVDVAGLEKLRDTEFSSRVFSFSLSAPEDGKAFLERDFCRALNCYPFVTQEGQYSAKRYKIPSPPAITLTEDDILQYAWDGSEAVIINQVEFTYDWNGATEVFGTRQIYAADIGPTNSKSRYGFRPALRVAFKGIQTASGGQAILDELALQLLQRFADPPPTLRITTGYGRHVLDIGDIIGVTHARIPNRRTGRRGMTGEIFEVRDLQPMFGAEGRVVLTLLHTGAQGAIPAPSSTGPKAI